MHHAQRFWWVVTLENFVFVSPIFLFVSIVTFFLTIVFMFILTIHTSSCNTNFRTLSPCMICTCGFNECQHPHYDSCSYDPFLMIRIAIPGSSGYVTALATRRSPIRRLTTYRNLRRPKKLSVEGCLVRDGGNKRRVCSQTPTRALPPL